MGIDLQTRSENVYGGYNNNYDYNIYTGMPIHLRMVYDRVLCKNKRKSNNLINKIYCKSEEKG